MWLIDVLRRIKLAGLLFLTIILIGTVGFAYFSGGDWINAFYMTTLTLTTIGFHEVIDLSGSPAGRMFTVFVAFSGIGIFTYFISNLAALFIEGDIRRSFYKRKMEKKISKMEDHYIVCGLGRVGRTIAEELAITRRAVVLADIEQDNLEDLPEELSELPWLVGDCTEEEFLNSLSIETAKGIFICTREDNTNLVICLTARQLSSSIKIVVRSKDVNLTNKLKRAGADNIISPNHIGGIRMASEMMHPSVTSFLDDMTRNSSISTRIEEVKVGEKYSGRKIADLNLEKYQHTLLLAVREDGAYDYIPQQDRELKKGSQLILMTTPENRQAIEDRIS
ncbi:potassium channel family protein [Marinoscillum sp.]|uniref:potassium channel family protein n=1 Tax=Marinoscillum sp. TaxID=2024838 RepID=UPI003BAD1E8B